MVDFLGLVEVTIVELVNGLRKKGSTSDRENGTLADYYPFCANLVMKLGFFQRKVTLHSATVDFEYITTRIKGN